MLACENLITMHDKGHNPPVLTEQLFRFLPYQWPYQSFSLGIRKALITATRLSIS